jgi:hypothetical protein
MLWSSVVHAQWLSMLGAVPLAAGFIAWAAFRSRQTK